MHNETIAQQLAREVEKDSQAKCATANIGSGMAGCAIGLNDHYRPDTLSQRISARLVYAEQESRRAGSLNELRYLLDKNPDVARILDLIDEVGR